MHPRTGKIPTAARTARRLFQRPWNFQQSAPPQLLECVHLRSGRLYLFRHAVRAVWSAGSHDPRTFDFAARTALGHKRSHCAGLSVLSRYPIGRHRCERAAGRRQNAEGFFASHIHELPSVRRAFKRAARNGIGLLLFEPELCAAGRGGRIVYPAARADPNLRADDAYLPLLRRGIRGSYTKIPKKQTTNARTALKEKTEE